MKKKYLHQKAKLKRFFCKNAYKETPNQFWQISKDYGNRCGATGIRTLDLRAASATL